ncbi:hypothetical protein DEAB109302_06110 [Dermacoccus abyssi]
MRSQPRASILAVRFPISAPRLLATTAWAVNPPALPGTRHVGQEGVVGLAASAGADPAMATEGTAQAAPRATVRRETSFMTTPECAGTFHPQYDTCRSSTGTERPGIFAVGTTTGVAPPSCLLNGHEGRVCAARRSERGDRPRPLGMPRSCLGVSDQDVGSEVGSSCENLRVGCGLAKARNHVRRFSRPTVTPVSRSPEDAHRSTPPRWLETSSHRPHGGRCACRVR